MWNIIYSFYNCKDSSFLILNYLFSLKEYEKYEWIASTKIKNEVFLERTFKKQSENLGMLFQVERPET